MTKVTTIGLRPGLNLSTGHWPNASGFLAWPVDFEIHWPVWPVDFFQSQASSIVQHFNQLLRKKNQHCKYHG